jgi:hypothetical protein
VDDGTRVASVQREVLETCSPRSGVMGLTLRTHDGRDHAAVIVGLDGRDVRASFQPCADGSFGPKPGRGNNACRDG